MTAKRTKPYGYTDHQVADAYRRKGWSGHPNREAWVSSVCRYHGKMELPKDSACLLPQNRP